MQKRYHISCSNDLKMPVFLICFSLCALGRCSALASSTLSRKPVPYVFYRLLPFKRPDSFYLGRCSRHDSTSSIHGVVLHPCSRASLYLRHPFRRTDLSLNRMIIRLNRSQNRPQSGPFNSGLLGSGFLLRSTSAVVPDTALPPPSMESSCIHAVVRRSTTYIPIGVPTRLYLLHPCSRVPHPCGGDLWPCKSAVLGSVS